MIFLQSGYMDSCCLTGLIFSPFTLQLWILLIFAHLITSLVYWVISRIVAIEESNVTQSFWSIFSAFVFASTPSSEVIFPYSGSG